jgi:hypothetical protein
VRGREYADFDLRPLGVARSGPVNLACAPLLRAFSFAPGYDLLPVLFPGTDFVGPDALVAHCVGGLGPVQNAHAGS